MAVVASPSLATDGIPLSNALCVIEEPLGRLDRVDSPKPEDLPRKLVGWPFAGLLFQSTAVIGIHSVVSGQREEPAIVSAPFLTWVLCSVTT